MPPLAAPPAAPGPSEDEARREARVCGALVLAICLTGAVLGAWFAMTHLSD
jgi:hypothetical protein